jgi:hypothetical protein
MTRTPAQWLEERFDIQSQILGPVPENTGPLMSLKSIMDAGMPMQVRETDYDDPDGLWL